MQLPRSVSALSAQSRRNLLLALLAVPLIGGVQVARSLAQDAPSSPTTAQALPAAPALPVAPALPSVQTPVPDQPAPPPAQPNSTAAVAPVTGLAGPPPLAYWPTRGWQTRTPGDTGMDARALEEAFKYAFAVTGEDKDRKGIRSDGVVIIRHGYLVREQYGRGYHKDMRHLAWSVSKSFVNALFGMAVGDKLIRKEDRAYKYYPVMKDDAHRRITIEQLLQMSSGLYFNEGYEGSPLKSSVLGMLYTMGRKDMGLFAATQPVAFEAGSHWAYSSGTSNLLMALLKNVVGAGYDTWPWDRLFDKLGMERVVWERDASGTFVGSSYLYATPRDMARFGLLYLYNGYWEGQRLLPEGWVDWTTQVPVSLGKTTLAPTYRHVGGGHFWLNRPMLDQRRSRPLPDVPEDCFSADGHWGQNIWIIPSLDLVVVRTADDRDKSFQANKFLKYVVDSIKDRPQP